MTHILIVDDSPTETHILSTMLEKNGFSVITAENGEAGVSKAKEEKPDLILMDVVMPGMNGYEASREISADPETSAIPIIIVSSKNQQTDRMWGLRQGAKDYIGKPAQEDELLGKINALIGNQVYT